MHLWQWNGWIAFNISITLKKGDGKSLELKVGKVILDYFPISLDLNYKWSGFIRFYNVRKIEETMHNLFFWKFPPLVLVLWGNPRLNHRSSSIFRRFILSVLSLYGILLYTSPLITVVIQSTLVISKSKGLSETLRDIRISTYQMYRTEENTNRTTKFLKWTCNLTPLVRNICWKYCGKWEKLLLRSNFSPYPQYFITWP